MPSGAHLDVRGLQIAMDDPVLVRGFERFGDLLRDGQRFIEWNRPLRDPVRERRPSTSSITSAVDAVGCLRGREWPRCSDGSARRGLPLRAGTGPAARGSVATASGRTLMATSRSSFVSRRAIDLAHAARADLGRRFRTGRGGCRGERQTWGLYGRRPRGRAPGRAQKKIIRPGKLAGESADASRGMVRRATVVKEI